MARSDQPKFRTSCICRSILCRPCIRTARCGRAPATRSAPTSWRSLWAQRGAGSAITVCDGIIRARTGTTRRSAGPIINDVRTQIILPQIIRRTSDSGDATMAEAALETVLRRDRIVVAAALAALTALAWGYVLWLAADRDMGGMDMTGFR